MKTRSAIKTAEITLPLIIILTCVLALCGCEPCPHYDRLQVAAFYGPVKPPRKPRTSVIPFNTPADVGRPYRVIGFMSCEGSVGEEGGILKAMLYRAADMGADGIILNAGRISQESVLNNQKINLNINEGLIGEKIGNGDRRAYRADAILFTATNAP